MKLKLLMFGLITVLAMHAIAQTVVYVPIIQQGYSQQRGYSQQQGYSQQRGYYQQQHPQYGYERSYQMSRTNCFPQGHLEPVWRTVCSYDRYGRPHYVQRIVGWRMVYYSPYDNRRRYNDR